MICPSASLFLLMSAILIGVFGASGAMNSLPNVHTSSSLLTSQTAKFQSTKSHSLANKNGQHFLAMPKPQAQTFPRIALNKNKIRPRNGRQRGGGALLIPKANTIGDDYFYFQFGDDDDENNEKNKEKMNFDSDDERDKDFVPINNDANANGENDGHENLSFDELLEERMRHVDDMEYPMQSIYFQHLRGGISNAAIVHREHFELEEEDFKYFFEIRELLDYLGDFRQKREKIIINAADAAFSMNIFDRLHSKQIFCELKIRLNRESAEQILESLELSKLREELRFLNLTNLSGKTLGEKVQKMLNILEHAIEFYSQNLDNRQLEYNVKAKTKIDGIKGQMKNTKIFFKHLATILEATDDLWKKRGLSAKMLKEFLESAKHCPEERTNWMDMLENLN